MESTEPTSAPASPPAHASLIEASQNPSGDTACSKPARFARAQNHARARESRSRRESASVAPRAIRWLSAVAYRTSREPESKPSRASRTSAALRSRSRRAVAIASSAMPIGLAKNGSRKPSLTSENTAISTKGRTLTTRADSFACAVCTRSARRSSISL